MSSYVFQWAILHSKAKQHWLTPDACRTIKVDFRVLAFQIVQLIVAICCGDYCSQLLLLVLSLFVISVAFCDCYDAYHMPCLRANTPCQWFCYIVPQEGSYLNFCWKTETVQFMHAWLITSQILPLSAATNIEEFQAEAWLHQRVLWWVWCGYHLLSGDTFASHEFLAIALHLLRAFWSHSPLTITIRLQMTAFEICRFAFSGKSSLYSGLLFASQKEQGQP